MQLQIDYAAQPVCAKGLKYYAGIMLPNQKHWPRCPDIVRSSAPGADKQVCG